MSTLSLSLGNGERLQVFSEHQHGLVFVGQFHQSFSEQFDLMIKGKGLSELEHYRLELISRGIAAGEIPDEKFSQNRGTRRVSLKREAL